VIGHCCCGVCGAALDRLVCRMCPAAGACRRVLCARPTSRSLCAASCSPRCVSVMHTLPLMHVAASFVRAQPLASPRATTVDRLVCLRSCVTSKNPNRRRRTGACTNEKRQVGLGIRNILRTEGQSGMSKC
jgi:hypothetical protein